MSDWIVAMASSMILPTAWALKRFWRRGLLGFWMTERSRLRHLLRDEYLNNAERQHRQVLSGDNRGIYGNYPPAQY